MQTDVWENFISLNSTGDLKSEVLGPARDYVSQRDGSVDWNEIELPLDLAMNRDVSPIPIEADRELYYGPNHFNYWASGVRDLMQILEWARGQGIKLESSLDIGCASGRVMRHMHYQTNIKQVMGCDINRLHVDWVARHLPPEITVFQNSSIPSLPLPSESVDLVTAFSVFTHIESFDTTWLMELRRILKPGGIAWLTVHGERTWREVAPGWPLYQALHAHPDFAAMRGLPQLPSDRVIFRWRADRSYSANIFYRDAYIEKCWGRILEFKGMFPALPHFQDVVVLQKPNP